MRPSRELVVALRLSEKPQYAIARRAGIHPNLLSKLIHGIERIRPYDDRLIAVGKVLGIPPEKCFEAPLASDLPNGDIVA